MRKEQPLSGRTRLPLIRLGWQQLAVVIAGLAMVLAVVVAFCAYDWANLYAARIGLKEFERSFGFKWGPVWMGAPNNSYWWCVVSVVPGGPFDRLGLRQGDAPITEGRGAYVMHEALTASVAGRTGEFEVLNIHGRWSDRRWVEVPPLKTLKQPPPQTEPVTLPSSQNAPSCWSDPRIPAILALGKDHAPDAHARLKAIAAEAQSSEGREMTKVMLRNWDEKDGSYRSEYPQQVDRLAVSMDEKRKVLPPQIRQTILIFDVLVDERGCTAKVDVVRRGDYPAFLDLVLMKVKELRYIPKKDLNRYVAQKIVWTLNQEVN